MSPVIRDEWDRVVALTPLRERRLLALAHFGGNHKAFYSQYCLLMAERLVTWTLGTAFLTHAGRRRLSDLLRQEYQ